MLVLDKILGLRLRLTVGGWSMGWLEEVFVVL